jgi:hypothetical protein
VMITLPQGDLPKDLGILRTVAQYNRWLPESMQLSMGAEEQFVAETKSDSKGRC